VLDNASLEIGNTQRRINHLALEKFGPQLFNYFFYCK